MPLYESDVEKMVIEMLESQGYKYLSPEDQEEERGSLDNVVLKERLKEAIDRLNPDVSSEIKEQALKEVLNFPSQDIVSNNEYFHNILTNGVKVMDYEDGYERGKHVQIVDFEEKENNDFVVTNQFSVVSGNKTKRPDVVILINGLPFVVIELKNPSDENATVDKAFTQLQNYKDAIPELFYFNEVMIASDGLDAVCGSVTSGRSRFMAWKSVAGEKHASNTTPQIETISEGLLRKEVLLDFIRFFVVFEKSKSEDPNTGITNIEVVKKIAAYHQYFAVNKAVATTISASRKDGDRKAGVVWHTQGSGKSLSMVFYSGKIVQELDNPTIVVITDRNDLDDQLFETFANSKELLRQTPVQAENTDHLKELLKTSGGGIIFTTIQKFSTSSEKAEFDLLSERENIVVVADEAHRSQYGFGAKTDIKDGKALVSYGFAKYLRDAIPNASFIGFTGTPVELGDKSTKNVFGDYVDVYDIEQAVQDGATVRILYESRLVKVNLDDQVKKELDREMEMLAEEMEMDESEKSKTKWAQIEAIIGHPERLKTIAKDIVKHFEERQEAFDGKAMIVCMSRKIAVDLYDEIVKLKPDWHSEDQTKGSIKVIMTSSSSDPASWQIHNTTKRERKALGARLKDENDPLKMVIVRDMWLTGFDAPCLKTMYIDKPMKGHNLMQAIARVNRVYGDIEAGLIVDYIGIASDLKNALNVYTESGGEGEPTVDINDAVMAMLEKFEVVEQMFSGFDYKKYFDADTREKMTLILEAQEHILGLPEGKERFIKEVTLLSKAYAICVTHPKADEVKDEVGFFQAVKARLVKYDTSGTSGATRHEIDSAIKQLVDKAVVSEGVIDIFDAAGIKKPDISIFSDEFLEEVRNMKRKNIALELLKKILNDEVKTRGSKNLVQSKKLSEMLESTIKRYHNNQLTSAEVIEELINLAKDIRNDDEKKKALGLSDDEIAFYDALASNGSAKEIMGDKKLFELAHILVDKVRKNTSIDWTIKSSVQAKLRVLVKRTLRKFGYPPDAEKLATEKILKQAELYASEWC